MIPSMPRLPFPSLLPTLLLSLLAPAGTPGGVVAQGVPLDREGPPALEAGIPDIQVLEHTLVNGMRLLIVPRPAVPTVSFVVEYRVGGVDEAPGKTGIAHFLEHMLFKGTTSVGTRDAEEEASWFAAMDLLHDSARVERLGSDPDTARLRRWEEGIRALEDSARTHAVPGEFDRILSRNGARGLNATTSADATTYFVELPANRAKLWFVLEGDRMRNPVLREFHTERNVILEERRFRVDASPGGLLYETHLAAAFPAHPYGQPVIGHEHDILALSREDIADFLARYYAPSNAVVAVVGAVDPDSILTWARDHLAPVPAGEPPPPVLARDPEPRGERRVTVVHDSEPLLRMGWPTVSGDHPHLPALSVASSLLAGGRTSRLYRRLVVEERLATYVAVSLGPGFRYPTLFAVDAAPRAPHTTAELEAAILEELERLRTTPPGQEELDRLRIQLEAGRIRRLQSNLGLAFQLASSASTYGDWRQTFRFSEQMRSVTPEEVQEVVERYLTPRRMTVGVVERLSAGGDR
jgi:predicted Zn-dependent peptidase